MKVPILALCMIEVSGGLPVWYERVSFHTYRVSHQSILAVHHLPTHYYENCSKAFHTFILKINHNFLEKKFCKLMFLLKQSYLHYKCAIIRDLRNLFLLYYINFELNFKRKNSNCLVKFGKLKKRNACTVKNLYNYKTKKFVENFYWNLKNSWQYKRTLEPFIMNSAELKSMFMLKKMLHIML